ncbi:YihY/virulence factor BrkB family protein [Planotetraspora kaengkrachanensis]|uniref:Membrane protein n=1 Tax=Planotetraspora kaengkrachanensis TaxID=575193 RepID=A0A8J3V8W7_9ACTN|nr:YihY/virulence factor BrkB family protein [Planotetraspora kaengkrachanensis]GIG82331.1 membrane protein [Planotetraspora kaengkrachanensis]
MGTGIVQRVTRRADALRARGRDVIETQRIRHRWIDHLIRTVQRYQVQSGDRLAGAFTYFAFLSFFPLIALAFAVIQFFTPDVVETLIKAINEQLPGLASRLQIDKLKDVQTSAGVFGLVGLFYAGLGAMEALRSALREIWMVAEPPLNYFLGKLRDLVALVLVGVTMLVSVAVGGFATSATSTVTGWLGLGGTILSGPSVWITGLLVSLAADILLFLIMLGWLAKPAQPFLVILKGSLLGAVMFGLLKQLAALILAGTLRNPVYGAFAVIVGLLLWINLAARVILYSAAWTATATLGPPPEPTPVPSALGGQG